MTDSGFSFKPVNPGAAAPKASTPSAGSGFSFKPVNPSPKTAGFSFEPVDPSLGQKLKTLGTSISEGVTRSTPQLAGDIAGAASGAAIGALGGPLDFLTVPAGFVIGGVAGDIAGRKAGAAGVKALGLKTPDEYPPNLRPYAVGGEFFGSGLPFVAAPLGAARAGVRVGGKLLQSIIDEAAENPRWFALDQSWNVARPAIAGAAAEATSPGDKTNRLKEEVFWSLFNPVGVGLSIASGVKQGAGYAKTLFSTAAREAYAGSKLRGVLQAYGEGVDPLLANLEAPTTGAIAGVPLTAAQKTGSPTLAKIEASLAKKHPEFGATQETRAKVALDTIAKKIDELRGSGDPRALPAAAQMQAGRFKAALTASLDSAKALAVAAARKISADTSAARATISRVASEALGTALQRAREVEKELWARVPHNIRVNISNLKGAVATLRSQMLPEEKFPDIAANFIARVVKKGARSGDLILFRSRMLAMAREAAAQNRFNDARIFGSLAEASLADLDEMGANPAFGADGHTADAYTDARTFSHELNDVFTRGFTGKALATTARGDMRIPPELLMRSALASGGEVGALRFHELEQATRFLTTKGIASDTELQTVLHAQESTIRLMAHEAVDPTTGLVNPTRLAKLLRDNEALLDRFPEAKADFESALKSETRRREIEALAQGQSAEAMQSADFAKAARYENGTDAIENAVSRSQKTPTAALSDLAAVAKRAGPDAIEGLKASAYEYAVRGATRPDGSIDMVKLAKTLFSPIRPGQPSLVDTLAEKGIIAPADRAQLHDLLLAAGRIQASLASNGAIPLEEDAPGMLLDFMLRVEGASVGSVAGRLTNVLGPLGGGGAGHSMLAASAGSKAMQGLFDRLGRLKIDAILVKVMKDPKVAADILQRGTTPAQQASTAMRIISALTFTGLMPLGAAAQTYNENQPQESQAQP